MPQIRRPRARERATKGQVFAEQEITKPKITESVEFTSDGKTYVAKFDNPPKVGKIKLPEAESPKEANKGFITMVEGYGVQIYEKGKDTPIENPSKKLKIKAGKVALKDSMKYNIDIKKLVPIPKMKQ